jgi:hypothetical protein
MVSDDEIRNALLALALQRGPERSLCPSEIARSLSSDWRPLMAEIRRVGAGLVHEGKLRCTQRGVTAHPLTTKGAIRFSAAAAEE